MSTDATTVLSVINEFVERLEKEPGELSPSTPLFADGIGLDSVESAELSSILEDEFGTDPFSEGEVPETVGDILAFYERSSEI